MKSFYQNNINIKAIGFTMLIIIFSFSVMSKQVILLNERPTLEYLINQSETIIEGDVVSTTTFLSKNCIYTSALIKITKVFKGEISDSIIEIVYKGGEYGSQATLISDELAVEKGDDGIFLLMSNNTQAKLGENNMKSFVPRFGQMSLIGYHTSPHAATWFDIPYDDVERQVFQPIEIMTGQKRKVLGPNMFERPSKRPKE